MCCQATKETTEAIDHRLHVHHVQAQAAKASVDADEAHVGEKLGPRYVELKS